MIQEYRYHGQRFRQPLRLILSLLYTCKLYGDRFARKYDITAHAFFRAAGIMVSAILIMFGGVIGASYLLIPTPVHADSQQTIKEVAKLQGARKGRPQNLANIAVAQKSAEQNIPISKVDTDKSIVVATYPAPIVMPTTNNVSFKTKIVQKGSKQDKDKSKHKDAVKVVPTASSQSKEVQKSTAQPKKTSTVKPTETSKKAVMQSKDQQNDQTTETVIDNKSVVADPADKNVAVLKADSTNEQSQTEKTDDDNPVIMLRSDEAEVNLHDAYNPASLVGWIETNDDTLPVLKIDTDLNTDKPGKYTVVFKIVDKQGKTDSQTATLVVKEHPEQIAEAKRLAEEAKAKAEADAWKAKLQAIKDAGGLLTDERPDKKEGAIYNPYPGNNYNNCTWGAWQLAYEKDGVRLPAWGNANEWLANAQRDGYATGTIPMKGAIQVSGGGVEGMGHVSYVANISKDGKSVYIMQGSYTDGSGVPFSGSYSELWQNAYGNLISGMPILGYIYLR